jgi:hypothetical protein
MSDAKHFDDAQLASLGAVLDTLIPPCPERGLPGAGELGLASAVADEIGSAPALVELIAAGLTRIEANAGAAAGFAGLELDARSRLLHRDDTSEPGFVGMLIAPTYLRYYEHPTVLEALGLEARPPHPLGHSLEPGDPALLDPVRRRPRFYRDG